jgi:hypothetical protein
MIEIKTKAPLTLDTRYGGGCPVKLLAARYSANDRIALMLVSNDGLGEPVATITCNIPSAKLEPFEVIVKDWSENEDMEDWLIDSGIAYATGKVVHSGFVQAPIVRLKASIMQQITNAAN